MDEPLAKTCWHLLWHVLDLISAAVRMKAVWANESTLQGFFDIGVQISIFVGFKRWLARRRSSRDHQFNPINLWQCHCCCYLKLKCPLMRRDITWNGIIKRDPREVEIKQITGGVAVKSAATTTTNVTWLQLLLAIQFDWSSRTQEELISIFMRFASPPRRKFKAIQSWKHSSSAFTLKMSYFKQQVSLREQTLPQQQQIVALRLTKLAFITATTGSLYFGGKR